MMSFLSTFTASDNNSEERRAHLFQPHAAAIYSSFPEQSLDLVENRYCYISHTPDSPSIYTVSNSWVDYQDSVLGN